MGEAVVTEGTREDEFKRDHGALPQNLNWAVKIEYATPLFDPPPPRATAGSHREVVDRASRAVCIVLTSP